MRALAPDVVRVVDRRGEELELRVVEVIAVRAAGVGRVFGSRHAYTAVVVPVHDRGHSDLPRVNKRRLRGKQRQAHLFELAPTATDQVVHGLNVSHADFFV